MQSTAEQTTAKQTTATTGLYCLDVCFCFVFMSQPGQTLRQRRNVLNPSVIVVRPSVCYQTCEYDILKTSEPILMPISRSGLRGKGVKG